MSMLLNSLLCRPDITNMTDGDTGFYKICRTKISCSLMPRVKTLDKLSQLCSCCQSCPVSMALVCLVDAIAVKSKKHKLTLMVLK